MLLESVPLLEVLDAANSTIKGRPDKAGMDIPEFLPRLQVLDLDSTRDITIMTLILASSLPIWRIDVQV
ncbi:hypothetical protein HDU76_002701 [Blyttiomyces sp. JEL0837]|nr:hypothetical protein HDU76_002701 [Blyttiomyces sp. JEL0837]